MRFKDARCECQNWSGLERCGDGLALGFGPEDRVLFRKAEQGLAG